MNGPNDAKSSTGSTLDAKGTLTPIEQPRLDEKDDSILIVDWDGPDDPQNPKNWSFRRKWAATIIVSMFAFISTITSSIIAPASSQAASEFGVHNSVVSALTMSIFVLAYAFGPLILSPLSEIYGRCRVIQFANLWFLAWNIGCSLAQSEGQLLAFRFLAGLGGCAPVTIAGGVLGDCWRTEERGQAMAVYSLTPMLGPVIGPLVGAWIAQYSSWRWGFWATTIADAFVQLLGLFLLRESFAPVLLKRKAKAIRNSMDLEKSSYREVRTVFEMKEDRSWKAAVTKALVRPFTLLMQEPIIQCLGLYMAYLYGILYIFVTTMPTIFQEVYNQPLGIAGLHYIAFSLGLSGAAQINARMMDRLYLYLKSRNGGVGIPEFRLPSMFIGSLALPIGLLITGWTVQARVFWIVPDIGIFLVGMGIILNYQCIQTYVVDAFTLYAASAMAVISFTRSIAGCGFPLFAPAMFSALGYGLGNTVLAVISIVIGAPASWMFWRYGERIRQASYHARS